MAPLFSHKQKAGFLMTRFNSKQIAVSVRHIDIIQVLQALVGPVFLVKKVWTHYADKHKSNLLEYVGKKY